MDTEEKIWEIIMKYYTAYHNAIKCTPEEAWRDETGLVIWQNSPENKYTERFRRGFREKFGTGEIVRVAKKENLKGCAKDVKGRFLNTGTVIEVCGGDSYLVRMNDGRLVKKRHADLKKFIEDIGKKDETKPSRGGDVVG